MYRYILPFNTPLDLSRLSLAWAMSRHRPCSCELLVAMCLVLRLDWVELWFSSSKWKLTSATPTYTNYTSKKQRREVAWKSQKFVSNFEISSFLGIHSQVSMLFFVSKHQLIVTVEYWMNILHPPGDRHWQVDGTRGPPRHGNLASVSWCPKRGRLETFGDDNSPGVMSHYATK